LIEKMVKEAPAIGWCQCADEIPDVERLESSVATRAFVDDQLSQMGWQVPGTRENVVPSAQTTLVQLGKPSWADPWAMQ
jgi:hypothetical protein